VAINLTVHSTTSCIVLNAGKFNYSEVTIDGTAVIDISQSDGFLTLTPPATTGAAALSPNSHHLLVMVYSGFVRDDTASGADDGAAGVFLSPNTVPPPEKQSDLTSAVADGTAHSSMSEVLTAWRLHQHQRRRTHHSGASIPFSHTSSAQIAKGKPRSSSGRRGPAHWRDGLRVARQKGEELMIATQFEATDARNMFPSFDEPVYKATFDATIVVPSGLQAFFNTPLATQTKAVGATGDPTTVFTFKRTMHPLPTYLVALAVGQ
jgi:hypothetical protein